MLRSRAPRSVPPGGVSGTGSTTLGDLLCGANGAVSTAWGSASPSLGNYALTAFGYTGNFGAADSLLGGFGVVAFGTGIPQAGVAACAVDDLGCDAVGARGAAGVADAPVAEAVIAEAFGTWEPPFVAGIVRTAIDSLTCVAVGIQRPTGVAATALADFGVYAVGEIAIFGSLSVTLDIDVNAAGYAPAVGIGMAVIPPMLADITAFVPEAVTGNADTILSAAGVVNPCFAIGWVAATGFHVGLITGLNFGATFAPDGQLRTQNATAFFRERTQGPLYVTLGNFVTATVGFAPVRRDLAYDQPMEIGAFVGSAIASHAPAVSGSADTGVGVLQIAPPGGYEFGTSAAVGSSVVGATSVPLGVFATDTFGICWVAGATKSLFSPEPIPLGDFVFIAPAIHAPHVYCTTPPAGAAITSVFTGGAYGIAAIIGRSGAYDIVTSTVIGGNFSTQTFGRQITPIFASAAGEFEFVPDPVDMWQVRYTVAAGVPTIRAGQQVIGSRTGAKGTVYSNTILNDSVGRLLLQYTTPGRFTYPGNTVPSVIKFMMSDGLDVRLSTGALERRGTVTSTESGGFPGSNSEQTQEVQVRSLDFGEQTLMPLEAYGIACVMNDPVETVPCELASNAASSLRGLGVGARGNSGYANDGAPNMWNLAPVTAAAIGYTFVGIGDATLSLVPYGYVYAFGQGRWDPRPPLVGEAYSTLPMPSGQAYGITLVLGDGDARTASMFAAAEGISLVNGVGQAVVLGPVLGLGYADFLHPLDVGCVSCIVAGAPQFTTGMFTFHFETSCIEIAPNAEPTETVEISVSEIYDACQLAQASEQGIVFGQIARASGLTTLTQDVQVALTVELLGTWHICFEDGLYQARINGGNLTGSELGGPIAFSPTTQVVLVQAASAMVITGSAPSADDVATAVWSKTLPLP